MVIDKTNLHDKKKRTRKRIKFLSPKKLFLLDYLLLNKYISIEFVPLGIGRL